MEKQPKKPQLTAVKSDFNFEMTTWMVVNNIAISKLKKKSFVDFLKKYMMHPIPCHMTIRREIDNVFNNKMNEIRSQLKQNYVWMQIDMTTSSDGRCVANVIIGILTSYESRKSFLVNCADLEGKVNHQNNLWSNR